MKTTLLAALIGFSSFTALATANLPAQIQQDCQQYLGALFTHFHQNPELSHMEVNTAKRLAQELRNAGFDVTEGVGKTGVVAMLKKRRKSRL
uniref:N-acetyl-L,L-diaminopimelate deacetylase n=1 Tax=Rheinheimera sp. BAL341 TaxID=1708203 RepID=A0A486XIL5_9GAMM